MKKVRLKGMKIKRTKIRAVQKIKVAFLHTVHANH